MTEPSTDGRQKSCPACGQLFVCGAKTECASACSESWNCWCAELPPLPRLETGADCLCRDCLLKKLAEQSQQNSP